MAGIVDFSQWLQRELEQRGWRQADLARHSGIDSGLLSRVLNGERKPGVETCRAIARAFGLKDIQVLEIAGLATDADEDVSKATKAAVREAQRERDEAKAKRAALLNAQHEAERRRRGREALIERARQWRARVDDGDFEFRREVLEALEVRVVFRGDVVEVGTVLSRPQALGYLPARRYRRLIGG